jgi:hypothetical protein
MCRGSLIRTLFIPRSINIGDLPYLPSLRFEISTVYTLASVPFTNIFQMRFITATSIALLVDQSLASAIVIDHAKVLQAENLKRGESHDERGIPILNSLSL